jgi:hypothetical protein
VSFRPSELWIIELSAQCRVGEMVT